MSNLILVLQIVFSLILSLFILIQVKGTGFGRVWGASASSFTRRGLESLVFKLTFVLTFIFILISTISFIV
jgi:protein translocase SecG subunit